MNYIELGNRIREYRKNIGLSQEKFALLIDMDRTYYSAVENGKHNVTIGNLEKITKGLNISLSKLLQDI